MAMVECRVMRWGTTMKSTIQIFVCGVVAAVLLTAVSPARGLAQYVRITGEAVNVRTEPSTQSTVIVVAERGDVFEFEGRRGPWLEINMFSGEYRWVHESLAEVTSVAPQMPTSEATRRSAFVAVVRAQDRALAESERRFPDGTNSNIDYIIARIDYERLLYDRFELPIFRRHGIAPALRIPLNSEGIRKNWVPPLDG